MRGVGRTRHSHPHPRHHCTHPQVVPGQTIVEVKPQGVSKGKAAERIMHDAGAVQFVLCIGNDRSDEDMFGAILSHAAATESGGGAVFACTVGQRPSRALFYVNDQADVVATLARLAEGPGGGEGKGGAHTVSFAE